MLIGKKEKKKEKMSFLESLYIRLNFKVGDEVMVSAMGFVSDEKAKILEIDNDTLIVMLEGRDDEFVPNKYKAYLPVSCIYKIKKRKTKKGMRLTIKILALIIIEVFFWLGFFWYLSSKPNLPEYEGLYWVGICLKGFMLWCVVKGIQFAVILGRK